MNQVYLLLGSNKGYRYKYLLLAKYYIQQVAGNISRQSSVYETEPWGTTHTSNYLNQIVVIQTPKTPFQLLKVLQKIEKNLGRKNKHLNAARTIDIDILFYNELIFHAKNLTIPHPRLHLRNFTLQPLLELDKSYTHPIYKKTIEELAKDCEDDMKVGIFRKANTNSRIK